MATLKTPALITKTMDWRDSSKIITLFCREHGRLDVIAKGSNRPKSPYVGILEALNLIEAVIHFSDKRELQLLGKADLETSFAGIKTDLVKTGYALGILEILNTFFKDPEPAAEFYDFVIYLLGEMEAGGKAKTFFWYFMLKLTSYLGFRPEFTACRICHKTVQEERVHFSFGSGAVVCAGCADAGEEGFQLPAGVCGYLAGLQGTHYKKVGTVPDPDIDDGMITGFLLGYLRFHTSEKLELHALNYYTLNENH